MKGRSRVGAGGGVASAGHVWGGIKLDSGRLRAGGGRTLSPFLSRGSETDSLDRLEIKPRTSLLQRHASVLANAIKPLSTVYETSHARVCEIVWCCAHGCGLAPAPARGTSVSEARGQSTVPPLRQLVGCSVVAVCAPGRAVRLEYRPYGFRNSTERGATSVHQCDKF